MDTAVDLILARRQSVRFRINAQPAPHSKICFLYPHGLLGVLAC